MAVAYTPWMGSFTLNDTDAHQLSAILADAAYIAAAYHPFFGQFTGMAPKCQYLVIGNDFQNGGKKLYIGNEGVSLTFFGDKLVAGQNVPFYSMETDLIRVDQIWVLADTTGLVVTVKLLTR